MSRDKVYLFDGEVGRRVFFSRRAANFFMDANVGVLVEVPVEGFKRYVKTENLSDYKKLRFDKVASGDYVVIRGSGSIVRRFCNFCGKELKIFNDGHNRGKRVSLSNRWVDYCDVVCKRRDRVRLRVCVCGESFRPVTNQKSCDNCRGRK